MVLLRWMHLRKLVPLADVIEQLTTGRPGIGGGGGKTAARAMSTAPLTQPTQPAPAGLRVSASQPAATPAPRTVRPAAAPLRRAGSAGPAGSPPASAAAASGPVPESGLKDAFLGEIRAGKQFFYNTVVAQAQRIDLSGDSITFTFLPTHRALREQFEQTRGWLQATAERLAGRRIAVVAVQAESASEGTEPAPVTEPSPGESSGGRDLKAEAMASSAVQAMLDVFPAEIRDVEEM
jgi:hypothetical protein